VQDIGVHMRDVFRKKFPGVDIKYIGGWRSAVTTFRKQTAPAPCMPNTGLLGCLVACRSYIVQLPQLPLTLPIPLRSPCYACCACGVAPAVAGADPSYMIRSIPTITTDRIYCKVLGQGAVHGAFAGYTDFTVGLVNT
jgi:hypothetical protein